MATMILIDKPAAAELARVYRERLMAQAELAAKKELVSMSTAIDAAAAKGNYELSYRLSGSITKLLGDYHTRAMELINADIENGGYAATPNMRNDVVIGYELNWGEQQPDAGENEGQGGEEEPVNPNPDPGEGQGEGSGEGGEEQTPVVTPAEDQDAYHYVALTAEDTADKNPANEGWVELIDGQFIVSTDTEANAEKTYYRAKTEEELTPENIDAQISTEPHYSTTGTDAFYAVDYYGEDWWHTVDPRRQGWYEEANGGFVPTEDTAVEFVDDEPSKIYYVRRSL